MTIFALRKELSRLTELGAERFVLAVDAPLSTNQTGLLPRRRVAQKGEKGAIAYRSCETKLVDKVRAIGGPFRRTVNVQPGAPLPPRVARLSERLQHELGFTYFTGQLGNHAEASRVLIEAYPFEAIWAMGVSGFYGESTPDWVTIYKSLERCIISREDGGEFARRPMRAYLSLLSSLAGLSSTIDTVSAWACDGKGGDDSFKVTRRYEAVVNASLVWLTAIAFELGHYHAFIGDEGDGALVGPGAIET